MKPTDRHRLLALLVFHNEMRYLPGWFENVPPHVDGVVALDDGSTDGSGDFVAAQPSVLEIIRVPPREPHVWDDGVNHSRVIEAALRHQPDWMIGLDADERLEREFRTRAEAELRRADRKGYVAYSLLLRELWDDPHTYRADGVWGNKRRARLFKNVPGLRYDARQLHGQWAPLNGFRVLLKRIPLGYPKADLIFYHLRMIDAADRAARRDRYNQLDPTRRFQKMGYDYLTDAKGLKLKELPPGRGYEPLGR
jgi:hypothetical protein